MSAKLAIIVPTRNRPQNIKRVIHAWSETRAFESADLWIATDASDVRLDEYKQLDVNHRTLSGWVPTVPKLNQVAMSLAPHYWAMGFAGDDHVPRTVGWAQRYIEELTDLGTGIVYGDDLIQGPRLPTQWAMTTDIITALGRMVPANVAHLYCDNAVKALGDAAQCLRYVSDVVIEHMHPVVHKAEMDTGYEWANSADRYRRDQHTYSEWLRQGLLRDAERVRALRTINT